MVEVWSKDDIRARLLLRPAGELPCLFLVSAGCWLPLACGYLTLVSASTLTWCLPSLWDGIQTPSCYFLKKFMYLLVLQHILVVARGALFLWREGSLAVVCRLSCPLAHGLLVSQPWIKPASPALEGRFLTTGPPGRSQIPRLGRLAGQQSHWTRGSLY